ncbi:MAG TPA: C-terminal binding protein [Tepidisphaeraceae bacterium]|jgi:D-3-phosphoglycerate dehydrogenase
MPTVFVTDYSFANLDPERSVLGPTGCAIHHAQCKTAAEVIAGGRDADVLMVQWAPITAEVLDALPKCQLIVRYGIGVDNVDLKAAKARGIPVCNVPDYAIDEVADHAVAMALALGRQLPQLDRRLRTGVWKLAPITPMPAFREMTFAVAGFGRIGRAVLERARAFKFRLAAYDPFVKAEQFAAADVRPMSIENLFAEADVISLHMPLNEQTRHMVSAARLAEMKPTSILINTARGGLIDTIALASALRQKSIGYAGIDVFETEPLPADHPLLQCDNALLTSHMAWHSQQSLSRLQQMAAEETARFLRAEPLQNQVN